MVGLKKKDSNLIKVGNLVQFISYYDELRDKPNELECWYISKILPKTPFLILSFKLYKSAWKTGEPFFWVKVLFKNQVGYIICSKNQIEKV